MRKILLFAAAIAFAFGAFLASCATQAQIVSKSATVSSNQATLKLLPATAFAGLHSEMARDGGAKPDLPCTTATT
jgi:galactitol-specific phosphotransferase system IIC component